MPFPRHHAALLDNLSPATRQAVLQAGTERRYRDGQVIHRQGDSNRALQVILEGAVTFSRLDAEGRQVTMATVGAGGIFGQIPLLTGRLRTHDAMAAGDARVLHITPESFNGLLQRHPDLREALLADLADALAQALDLLDDSQRLALPQRMARYLLANAGSPEPGGPPTVHASQSDIASALNVTREAVAMALKHFRADGMVETRYRAIVLARPDALHAIARLPPP